jgi:hypothetical protein
VLFPEQLPQFAQFVALAQLIHLGANLPSLLDETLDRLL